MAITSATALRSPARISSQPFRFSGTLRAGGSPALTDATHPRIANCGSRNPPEGRQASSSPAIGSTPRSTTTVPA